jgi:urease accessory protein
MSKEPDDQMTKFTWLVWQLADSAFPTGAFAHSFGLEAAWQQGEVTAASLPSFVGDAIAQAGHGGLPFVVAAHDDPADLPAIDERCDAFLRNVVANRASRVQGRAWLGTVERSFPSRDVCELCESIRSSAAARHFAPAFGATLRTLGVDRQEASRLYLFGVARGTLSAAVRLGIVGTTDAQRILSERYEDLDRTIRRCGDVVIDGAAQTSPLIDLWQAAHDRLYSRLFQS